MPDKKKKSAHKDNAKAEPGKATKNQIADKDLDKVSGGGLVQSEGWIDIREKWVKI